MFSCEICETFKNIFFHRTSSWLLLFFLKQRSKKEKICSHKYILRKAPLIVPFHGLLGHGPFQYNNCRLEFTVIRKKETILDVFCKIWEVLQNLIFIEDSRATASDLQQHFGHIACSISNKST